MAIRYLSGINVDNNVLFVDDANNRVGVGTASPSTSLDVIGTVTAYRYQAISSSASLVGYGVGTGLGMFNAGIDTLGFATASTERLRITAAGNVGIGTTAPGSLLHISGSGDTFTRYTNTTSVGHYVDVGANSAGQSFVYSYGAYPLLIGTNGITQMTVLSTGNVGIGTTSPLAKLQVSGGRAYFFSGDNYSVGLAQTAAQGNYMYLGTASDGTFYISETSGTARVTVQQGGNVGIGTTAPGSKLQVGGSGAAAVATPTAIQLDNSYRNAVGGNTSLKFYLYRSGNETYGIGLNNAAGTEFHAGTNGGAASAYYAFYQEGSEKVRIAAGGNVGIGTTSPSEKLHVVGNANVSGYVYTSTLYVSNTNGTATVNAYSGGSIGTYLAKASSATANFTTTGVSYPRGLGFGAIIGQGNTTDIPVNNASWNGGYGGNIGFWSDVHYGVEGGTNSIGFNAVIKGSGNSNSYGFFSDLSGVTDGVRYGIYTKGEQQNYFSGNLGIGTTSPAQKLTVSGSTGDILGITNGTTTGYGYVDNNGFGLFTSSSGGGTGIYYRTANIIDHYVNGSIAMRLNSTGNVGIGTTSPTSIGTGITSLDIQGSNAGGIAFGPSGTKNYIYGASTMYVEAHTTAVFSTSGTEKMRLTTGGQLIVGGTTVGYSGTKLQVGNTSDSQNGLNILTSTTGYGYILFGDGAAADTYVGQIWYYHGDNYMGFQTNGSEKMRITSAGNVGIGIQNPSYLLDVNGSINARSNSQVSGNAQVFTIDGTNHAYYAWSVAGSRKAYAGFGSSGSTTFELINENTGSFIIGTNGSQQLIITSAGNVGIGTTAPDQKLHVKRTETVNRTSYTDILTIDADANNSPYSGHGGGILFRGTTYSGGGNNIQGNRIWGRIGMFLNDFYDGFNGESMFFAVAPDDRSDTLTTAMTIQYNGNVGIGTTSPSQALHVSGSARVTGAYYDSNNSAGSSGQVLSSTGSGTAWVNQGEATATSLYDLLPAARTTYDWTVQLTAGTWADIFSSNTVLSNGTWMVQAYVSDFAVGGQQYQETYSGVMSWGNASSTNQGGVEAISEIILHRSGHAANAGNFYLRTVERASSTLLLQGMSNQTYSAASTINFKFVKIF